jgi:zinc protease
MGSPRTVGSFNRSDLEYAYRTFYNPPNLIMTIVSNIEPKKVMKWVKKRFKNMPNYPVKLGNTDIPEAGKLTGINEISQAMEKEQAYIYLGNVGPGIKSKVAPALTLAVEILSSRLKLGLREKEGLAYSVGAGVRYLGDFGWYTCTMGTGYKNFATARTGILAEIEKLANEPVSQSELDKARNSLWGSMLMRNMSCINQAYNMAYYEYVGVGYDYDDGYRERMDKVTIDDIRKVARDYLDPNNYVIAYVGQNIAVDSTAEEGMK